MDLSRCRKLWLHLEKGRARIGDQAGKPILCTRLQTTTYLDVFASIPRNWFSRNIPLSVRGVGLGRDHSLAVAARQFVANTSLTEPRAQASGILPLFNKLPAGAAYSGSSAHISESERSSGSSMSIILKASEPSFRVSSDV